MSRGQAHVEINSSEQRPRAAAQAAQGPIQFKSTLSGSHLGQKNLPSNGKKPGAGSELVGDAPTRVIGRASDTFRSSQSSLSGRKWETDQDETRKERKILVTVCPVLGGRERVEM